MTTALKNLLDKGKGQGFITYDEISDPFPQENLTLEQIDSTITTFSETGISVVHNQEDEEENKLNEKKGLDELVEEQEEDFLRQMIPCVFICIKF